MSEKALQDAVVDCAHRFGWHVAHFHKTFIEGRWFTPALADGNGWPDLFLVRRERAIAAELKSARGVVSVEQLTWLQLLGFVPGIMTAIWRPADWLDGTIESALR